MDRGGVHGNLLLAAQPEDHCLMLIPGWLDDRAGQGMRGMPGIGKTRSGPNANFFVNTLPLGEFNGTMRLLYTKDHPV